jgi:multiple sugar transport system substrate-binding protein
MDAERIVEGDSSKRLWISLGLVCLAVLVLSVTAPRPGARKYPRRKLVRFWHMWTSDWEKTVGKIADRFNESQTEYEVVPLSVPGGEADEKFSIAVAGSNPPDCMAQWNPIIPKWAESKLLLPLDELMGPQEWARRRQSIFPAALRVGSYKDHLYGLTIGLNLRALYYRPDFVAEAGLDPRHFPTTLEELDAWAGKLNKFDDKGQLVRVGLLPGGVNVAAGMNVFAPLFGGGFFDWRQGKLSLDTPQNMAALNWLSDFRSRLGFDKGIRFESSMQAAVGADFPLINGSYAMVIDGQWRVQELSKVAPGLAYLTAAIPPPRGGKKNATFSDGNFMIIPSTAHDPEGAWAFIKFWSGLDNPQRAAEFYTWGGWLPLDMEVERAPIYQAFVRAHPQFRTFVELLESPNVQPIPPVPYQVYLNDRILEMEQSVVSGSRKPRQAMDTLVQNVEQELAHRKEFGYVDER